MRIQAVAFDLGGVIFPWPEPDYFTRWENRLKPARGPFQALLWSSRDVEAANIGALAAEEYIARCAERLGAGEHLIREMLEYAFATDQVNDELLTYARSLRSSVRVAALTNTWSFGRKLAQARGIADAFDVFVSSAEVGARKPDRRIYEVLLRRLELNPSAVAFVDDTEENIESARSIGFQVVKHVSTAETIRELEHLIHGTMPQVRFTTKSDGSESRAQSSPPKPP